MNTRSTARFVGLSLTMAAALAMSGCGGGSSKSAGAGGGAPGGGAPGGGAPAPTQFSSFELTGAARGHLRAAAAKAARNTPNAGSVTQSSTGDGATTDSVSVTVVRGADGTMTYMVQEAGGWSVNRENARVLAEPRGEGWRGIEFHQAPGGGQGSGTGSGLYVDVYTDIEAPTTRTVPVSGNDGTVDVPEGSMIAGSGVTIISGGAIRGRPGSFRGQEGVFNCPRSCEINRGLASGQWSFTPNRPPGAQDVPGSAAGVVLTGTFNTSGTEGTFNGRAGSFRCLSTSCGRSVSNGRLSALRGDWIFVPSGGTTTETTPDADYLAGGIWVRVPADAASVADYEFGAFVDGSDPFRQANLAGLTGTATYTGDATAVYSYQPTERNYFVDGDVRLTADFGDASSLGSISGTVSNFEGEGPESDSYEGVSVTLGTARIGNADSGFFTGDTSTTGTDSAFAGKWGGQFYGNGAAASDHPGSVAGTFGGATADGSGSFVGVYGAYRQEQQ